MEISETLNLGEHLPEVAFVTVCLRPYLFVSDFENGTLKSCK